MLRRKVLIIQHAKGAVHPYCDSTASPSMEQAPLHVPDVNFLLHELKFQTQAHTSELRFNEGRSFETSKGSLHADKRM